MVGLGWGYEETDFDYLLIIFCKLQLIGRVTIRMQSCSICRFASGIYISPISDSVKSEVQQENASIMGGS